MLYPKEPLKKLIGNQLLTKSPLELLKDNFIECHAYVNPLQEMRGAMYNLYIQFLQAKSSSVRIILLVPMGLRT